MSRVSRLAVVAAVPLLLSGCASGSDLHVGPPAGAGGGDPETVALLEEALLTTAELGEEFVVDDEEDDEDDDTDMGCLGDAFDAIAEEGDGDGSGAMAEGAWIADTDFAMPIVSELLMEVGSDDAEEGFDFLTEELEGCDEIDVTDDDGSRIQLGVELDRDAVDGADEQLNIVAAGTISADGFELPFLLELRLASFEDHLMLVVYGNMAEPGDAGERVMAAAVERAVAVLAGDEAPEVEGLLDDELPDLSELEEAPEEDVSA